MDFDEVKTILQPCYFTTNQETNKLNIPSENFSEFLPKASHAAVFQSHCIDCTYE